MFKHYKRYGKILVTGPQRAGTRITAKIIASDLKYRYIDESEINTDNVKLAFEKFKSKTVLQAPGLCPYWAYWSSMPRRDYVNPTAKR